MFPGFLSLVSVCITLAIQHWRTVLEIWALRTPWFARMLVSMARTLPMSKGSARVGLESPPYDHCIQCACYRLLIADSLTCFLVTHGQARYLCVRRSSLINRCCANKCEVFYVQGLCSQRTIHILINYSIQARMPLSIQIFIKEWLLQSFPAGLSKILKLSFEIAFRDVGAVVDFNRRPQRCNKNLLQSTPTLCLFMCGRAAFTVIRHVRKLPTTL